MPPVREATEPTGVQMVQGMQAMVSSVDGAAAVMREQARDTATLHQALAKFSSDQATASRATQQSLDAIMRTEREIAQTLASLSRTSGGGGGGGPDVVAARRPEPPDLGRVVRQTEDQRVASNLDLLQRRGRATLGSLIQEGAGRGADALEARAGPASFEGLRTTGGEQIHVDEATGQLLGEGGRIVGDDEIDPASMAGKGMLARRGVGALRGLAAGGGVRGLAAGALSSTGVAVTGGVLAGGAVYRQAQDFLRGQREAAIPWQRTLGVSQGEAQQERFRSQMFEWGQSMFTFGQGLGAGQAEELYRGAAQVYGQNRDLRAIAQDFGIEMYRDLGMSVSESLGLVATAARTGNSSLVGLEESIKGVTQAAEDSNQNVEQFQQRFAQTFESLVPTAGQAAGAVSAAVTVAEAELGREYPNIRLGGLMSPEMIRAGAAAAYPTGDLTAEQIRMGRMDPTFLLERDPGTAGRLIENMARSQVSHLMTPQGLARWEEFTRQNPRASTEAQDEFLQQLRLEGGFVVGADVMAQQPIMRALGADAQTAPRIVAELAAGTFNLGRTIDETVGEHRAERLGRGVQGLELDASGLTPASFERWYEQDQPVPRHLAGFIRDFFPGGDPDSMETTLREANRLLDNGGEDEDRGWYILDVLRTGIRKPTVEAMLNNYDTDRRFKVKAAGGERVVNLGEALEAGMADQLQRGDVEIMEGAGAGETTAGEYARGVRDPTISVTSHTSDADIGKTLEEYGEDEGDGGSQQRVTIVPGPGLEGFFGPGGVFDLTDGQGNSLIPSPGKR